MAIAAEEAGPVTLKVGPVTPAGGGAFQCDALDKMALAYLALPVLIFLLGWFRTWVAIPLTVLLVIALRPMVVKPLGGWTGSGALSPRAVMAALVVAVTWTVLGGAGHLFYANFDWVVRDSVLRDLVVSAWPVGYGQVDGSELLLRAPLAYYLPAALVGKLVGLRWADLALLVWTVLGVALFLVLVVGRERRWTALCAILAVLVFFSGMDLLGTVIRGGWLLTKNLQATDHLEWWADRFQFSSHTTQLFWVPNHALPGWIATALLVRHRDQPGFAATLPGLVALLPLWSPLTAIGFLPLAAVWWAGQVMRRRTFVDVDWPALAASLILIVPIAAYLLMGAGTIRSGATTNPGESMSFYVPHYLQFVLLEVGILWGLLLAVRRDSLLLTAGLVLWLLPLAAFGPSNDLAMRGSIAPLMVVALAAAAVVSHSAEARRRRVYWPIVAILLLGAPTALTEMTRSIKERAWQPDYSHSLAPDPAEGYPPHYITRMQDSWISSVLRTVHDVNRFASPTPGKAGE